MKSFLSIKYSAASFNIALLVMRVGLSVLLMAHGYDKLVNFKEYQKMFLNFLGLGSTLSLSLSIFAEFFCSLLMILGLFSRLVAIPILINLGVAFFIAHNADFFDKGEHAALFIFGYFTILLVGPGRISVDRMINK